MKSNQLTAVIKNDQLMISIGIDTLQHACELGRRYGCGDIEVTNQEQFLSGLINELLREDEGGGTLIHRAFDSGINEMLENGEHGVDLIEES